MKILLLGKNGQLGYEIERSATRVGMNCYSLDMPQFDITDRKSVQEAVGKEDYSLVINAAAYTAVDKAETESDLAFEVNCSGPAHLASSCSKKGVSLIHISTDFVFDGKNRMPYRETDPVCPLSVYGRSKAAGESEVRDRLEKHIILRTSWLYSTHGNNFVKTILRLARENEELRVVDDQFGCPTYAADLATLILRFANHVHDVLPSVWGTYHYCGKGVATWHTFAEKIMELARKRAVFKCKRVRAISTEQYPTLAARPAYSALDCSKIEGLFRIKRRSWEESLGEMLNGMVSP